MSMELLRKVSGSYARVGKRVLDVGAATGAVLLLSPVMLLAAAAVKASSRGPALFGQERPGKNGKPFTILKFRSMKIFEDSYDSAGNELTNDERVTPVGRVLRRTSIDELPQLVNVLKGDMSIVGPRPALQYQVDRYTDEQRQRLLVRPGITGLAQVSGRNSLSWEEKIRLDLEYVQSLSLLADLRIIFKTFSVVAAGGGLHFRRHDSLSEHHGALRQHIGEDV